jgi:glutamate-1-semialdehyde 2,1-aminomutase
MAHFDKGKVAEDRWLMLVGTLSGNPVASVAGLATLEVLGRPGTYEKAFGMGRRLMEGLEESLRRHGVAGQVLGEPTLFDVVFCAEPVRNYRDVLKGDAALQRHVNVAMREAGILKGESKYYLSTAHGPAEIDNTVAAFDAALGSRARR